MSESLARVPTSYEVTLSDHTNVIQQALINRTSLEANAHSFSRDASKAEDAYHAAMREALSDDTKERQEQIRTRKALREAWIQFRQSARAEHDASIAQAKLFLATYREAVMLKQTLAETADRLEEEAPDAFTNTLRLRRMKAEKALAEAAQIVPEVKDAIRAS